MDDLAFARAQIGVSLAFHIVFAVIGVGMPLLMVISEALWLRTRARTYLELTRHWAKAPRSSSPSAQCRALCCPSSWDSSDDAFHRRWGTVFGAASALTPFFLGLCLGAVASGEIRVTAGRVTTGFFAGWTSPFAIGCGLFAQALFAFLAAVYLTVDTERVPALQEDFRRRGLIAGGVLIVVGAGVFALAGAGALLIVQGLTGPRGRWLLLVTAATAMGALALLWTRRFRGTRAAAIVEVALVVTGWGLAQYPYLVVPDLAVDGTKAPTSTLVRLNWVLAAGAVLLFPSFAYLYWIFKGRRRAPPYPGERAQLSV